MRLIDVIREERAIEGFAVTAGGLATALVWFVWFREPPPEPAPEPPCVSVPYAVGERPGCVEVANDLR